MRTIHKEQPELMAALISLVDNSEINWKNQSCSQFWMMMGMVGEMCSFSWKSLVLAEDPPRTGSTAFRNLLLVSFLQSLLCHAPFAPLCLHLPTGTFYTLAGMNSACEVHQILWEWLEILFPAGSATILRSQVLLEALERLGDKIGGRYSWGYCMRGDLWDNLGGN